MLTKLDLMGTGTNTLDILIGRVDPLKLGFIGVVNRSQADINNDKPLTDALDSDSEFFRNHAAYRNIAHNGTKYLAKTLNQVLMNHIRDKLPDMKARLDTLMGQAQQELNSFGDAAIYHDKNQVRLCYTRSARARMVNSRAARRARSAAHDPVRAGLCGVDRGHEHGHLDK